MKLYLYSTDCFSRPFNVKSFILMIGFPNWDTHLRGLSGSVGWIADESVGETDPPIRHQTYLGFGAYGNKTDR